MDSTISTAADKSNDIAKSEQRSIGSKRIGVCRGTGVKMMQNILLIWLSNKIDNNNEHCRNRITQLRSVVNDVNTFTDSDQCIQFINTITDNKICIIISGSLGQQTVHRIHNMSQLDSIFILCSNQKRHEQWAEEWYKIKGVFTEITSICDALKKASQQYEQNAISISFVPTNDDISSTNLDRLDPMFMYTQIMKEILLTITFEQKHFRQFIDYCYQQYSENDRELYNIKLLERTYYDKTPIWWYTSESFLYSMLNRALRAPQVDIIIKMGFFIRDLHHHIEELHKQQFGDPHDHTTFIVYRGQGLLTTDFDELKNTKGGLMSFNNFLSTSKDRNVSLRFAYNALDDPDSTGILFIMTIDPTESTTPFASVSDVGYFKEKENEVLFSMHTVFRIFDIQFIDENHRLAQVTLTLTADSNKDHRILTDRIREETFVDAEGWYRLGWVLYRMGQYQEAQQVYEVMLEQTTDENKKGAIYCQLGTAKSSQGEYNAAIAFYEKSIEISQKTLAPNDSFFAICYNNIGNVYSSMGEYSKTLSYYEKALEIQQQSLPSNHPDLAMTYNNMCEAYRNIDEHSKALLCHEKALKIEQKSLPPSHPNLAQSYNNIGGVYDNMGDYSKALSSHEKALEIQQQSLPPNHPNLANSYNNIGLVYYKMHEYSQALSYYEKAFEIRRKSLPSNHADLAGSYHNIGLVYSNTGEYSKALPSHEKALEIRRQSLRMNHSDLVDSYNNIGSMYYNINEYSKALLYYEKALDIREQSLPPNHPDLATCYNNIGSMYSNMGGYSKALPPQEKALEIKQQSLPANHPDLIFFYNSVGEVYRNMGEYSKALSFYEKAYDIGRQSVPLNHPNMAYFYCNIGEVYRNMGEYSKAFLYGQNALEIFQKSLSPNDPNLAESHNNIGLVYRDIGDYSKARLFCEGAVDIAQRSLPRKHPDRQKWQNNLEDVKKKSELEALF